MTAEMSSALPGRAGFVHWVERALSPRLGALNSFVSLLNTAVDASAYPGVCCDYLLFGLRRWGGLAEHLDATSVFWARTCSSIVLTCAMCAINMAGIRLATHTAIALAIFSFAPFALMALICCLQPWSSMHALHSALSSTHPRGATDLPLLLAVCLWATSGFDAVSFVSSEVGGSARTMPRGSI